MICHKTKSIFIHIPKTAGTSVEIMFGSVKHDKENNTFHETCQGKHMMLRNYIEHNPDITNKYYKWSIVRNSWEKDYSFYCMHKKIFEWHNQKPAKSFVNFLKHNIMPAWKYSQKYKKNEKLELTRRQWHATLVHANQLDYISINNEIAVDQIIQYHELKKGWENICKAIGKPLEPLIETRNIPNKIPIGELYNQESIDLVATMRKEDIEYFGYELPFKVN